MSRIMDEIREEGRAEGLEQGLEKGLEQGRRAQARESADKFRRMGLSIEQIAGGLGYTADTIEQWLKQPTA